MHFATLMDICHLRNAELEPKVQKDKGRAKGRFWLLCSNHRARSVCITNDGRKSNGRHCKATRMRRTSSRCSISSCRSQHGGSFSIVETSRVRKSGCLETSTTTQSGPHLGQTSKAQWFLLNDICTVTPLAGLLRERQFSKVRLGLGWQKVPNSECLFVHRK